MYPRLETSTLDGADLSQRLLSKPCETRVTIWRQWKAITKITPILERKYVILAFYSIWDVTSGLRVPNSAYSATWATRRLLSQWMLPWWQANWQRRASRFPGFSCTVSLPPSTNLDRQQVPFFKASVCPYPTGNPTQSTSFSGARSTPAPLLISLKIACTFSAQARR